MRSWPSTERPAEVVARPATRRALRVGLGAWGALTSGGDGKVLAWFPRACYVDGHGGLLVLVGPDVHPGPLYVCLDGDLAELERGTPATLSEAKVELPGCVVDLGDAEPWRGPLPHPELLRAAAGAVSDAAGEAARESLLPRAGFQARGLVERGNLAGAAAVLAGLGPGLTPSGDDVLSGVLFATRALAGPDREPVLAEIADGVRTNTIARAFLHWAARGQALSPVHDLVDAAVRGDERAARTAARALIEVGESSGADFALGLLWGMD